MPSESATIDVAELLKRRIPVARKASKAISHAAAGTFAGSASCRCVGRGRRWSEWNDGLQFAVSWPPQGILGLTRRTVSPSDVPDVVEATSDYLVWVGTTNHQFGRW